MIKDYHDKMASAGRNKMIADYKSRLLNNHSIAEDDDQKQKEINKAKVSNIPPKLRFILPFHLR